MKSCWAACALVVFAAGCSSQHSSEKVGAAGSPAHASAATNPDISVVLRANTKPIAGAPDRGVLIAFKKQAGKPRQTGAYTWYPVEVSEAHALKAVITGEMIVPAPDGSQVRLKYERHEEQADGNWTWIGRVVGGDQKQEAILTFGQNAVYGSIPQRSGAPLSLQTSGGALYAIQTDLSKVKTPNIAVTDMMVPPAMALRTALLSSAPRAPVSQAALGKAATAATTVDVAIGYTQGFATAKGGQSAAVTRLVYLIAVGNQAYENSLITGTLRLVNAIQVNYGDSTTNQTALEDLTGVRNDVPITVPAGLAPLRTAREQYGADIAILVRKFQTPENDGCGIAWLNGAGQTAINPTVDDDYGFAVISDGNDSGTDGNSYFCADETLVHEVGHLMGSAHDRDNSKSSTGALLYGRYPYSFGMKTTASNGNFYTIMAYGDNNQNFYRTFSNPLVRKCGGTGNLPCGVVDQTDNARSLNQTIPVVSQFRATVVPVTGALRHTDINGDGRSDLMWRNAADTSLEYWFMNGSSVLGTATISIGSVWQVAHVGDVSGDGKADIVWINSSQVAVSTSIGTSFVTTMISNARPAGLRVVGGGDINGDGKSDLVWRSADNTSMTYWLLNNNAVTGTGSIAIGPAWSVANVGDINGDGLSDIVWVTGTQVAASLSQGTSFNTVMVSSALPAGYRSVGGGDINGDGRSDLVWRNAANTSTLFWLMNGAAVQSSGTLGIGSNWELAYVGDTSGDGKADIIWVNSSQVAASQSEGSTFSTYIVNRARPAGWRIVSNL